MAVLKGENRREFRDWDQGGGREEGGGDGERGRERGTASQQSSGEFLISNFVATAATIPSATLHRYYTIKKGVLVKKNSLKTQGPKKVEARPVDMH